MVVVADLVEYSHDDSDPCQLCADTGTMSWEQPTPSAEGTVLRKIEMPCPNGCGGEWHHPAAQRGRVVEQPDGRPERVRGKVDEEKYIGTDFIRKALEGWGFRP